MGENGELEFTVIECSGVSAEKKSMKNGSIECHLRLINSGVFLKVEAEDGPHGPVHDFISIARRYVYRRSTSCSPVSVCPSVRPPVTLVYCI